MNLQREEGLALIDEVMKGMEGTDIEVVVAPPYLFIPEAVSRTKESELAVAAQNCNDKENGAFTGEVSATMLASFGCQLCIVGHSERREHYQEDNELANRKVKQLLEAGIRPILCVGETQEERQKEKHLKAVEEQIQSCLQGLTKEQLMYVVVAYEPIWAIGTGETATPEQAQEMHAFIRKKLSQVLGDGAEEVSIIYGGSVNPENAKGLFQEPDIDGALVGGASLKAEDFLQIIRSF